MVVIIIAAITSWLVPTRCYNTLFIGVMTKMERLNIGAEHSDKRTRLRNCRYVFISRYQDNALDILPIKTPL